MPRATVQYFLLVALLATAASAACGTSDASTDPSSPSNDGGPAVDGGGDPDAPIPDGPDVPPVAFPETVPLLFGYTLEDAFPGTFLSGAMDIDWPAGSKEPFVLQRGGHIVRLHGGGARTLVLDFEGLVAARGEAGALGMALHPKFADAADPHPYVYVWYNAEGSPTRQRLARFTWSAAAQSFDPSSQLVLVEQIEATTQHNGAHVRFGPDGFLYFGNGDDTRTLETTQRIDEGLFSGIFRIDVDQRGGAVSHAPPRQPMNATTQGYFVPNDNPFVGRPNVNEEYFALGVRNPYAFTFDRANGALWLGDVGDSFREEVNRVEAGKNYGWPFFEGTRQVRQGTIAIGELRPPAYEYTHASVADLVATMCGYVYRGKALPEIAGKLVFSDWPTGRIWALDTTSRVRTSLLESNEKNAPVGWGQDADGEIYVVSWGKVLKLVRAPGPHGVPQKLSETRVFRNVRTLKTPSALVPYTIASPLWSDGAAKQRWVYVPAGQRATTKPDGTIALPPGSLLVKHFELPANAQPVGRTKRLETRVLVVGKDTTYGITYRWNREGTDADLVVEAATETIDDANPDEKRTWHFPSTGECWSCHRAENRVLGFRGEQLNIQVDAKSQLAALAAANVIDADAVTSAPAPLATPSDTNASLEARATAYLAANCSPCHHPGASYLGGEETWNALPGVPLADRGLVGKPHHNPTMAATFGLPTAPLIAPGDPKGSILLQRLKTTDEDLRMPPILRTRIDPIGVSVIEAWIASM